MIHRCNWLIIIAIIFCSSAVSAQHKFEATLQPVEDGGYYRIQVTPELSSHLKTDLSDLRIIDEAGKQVPYIINHPKGTYANTSSRILPIISNTNYGGKTEIIIENPGLYRISNLKISLKNAQAKRHASLSGSDNNRDWYAVIDSFLYSDESTENWEFGFFPTSYAYFKLVIANGSNNPLNISKLETISDSVKEVNFPIWINNPALVLTREEQGSRSLITLRSDKPYHFNRIKINIKAATPYKRKIQFFAGEKQANSETQPGQVAAEFIISSDDTTAIELPLQKANRLFIIIENGDNPPLNITSIETMQPNRNIVSFLYKNIDYRLLLDDEMARKPEYDLDEFREGIPHGTPVSIKEISSLPVPATTGKTELLSKKWVWPVLAIVIGLLALLAWKLTRELKKEA